MFLDAPPISAAADWLLDEERNPPLLARDGSMLQVIDLFQSTPDLRLLPIVDAGMRPLGAVFERDVRRLLMNPFGHALLRNPSFGHDVHRHLRPCPVAEADLPLAELIAIYRASGGSEGMILTRRGRLVAVIANRRLLLLAARRVARAQRVEAVGMRLRAEVQGLATMLSDLAASIVADAATTADRAALSGERAAAVSVAAMQTTARMSEVAHRTRALADACALIADSTHEAGAAADTAVALVKDGTRQTDALRGAAHAIDAVVTLIGEIARKVNLLALNAAIEAQRAGEAGRGFTVVANEVKALSVQAGQATREIGDHVAVIRGAVGAVVEGNGRVEAQIDQMARLSDRIEREVREQVGSTQGIADAAQEVEDASLAIGDQVTGISDIARIASARADDMRALAGRLGEQSHVFGERIAALMGELEAA